MLYATALKRVPLLGGLDGSKVAQIVDASTAHDYDTGQLILRESEPGSDFFVILNGSVECTPAYAAGANDSVCPTLETGDFFGELSLTTGAPRAATCIALAECECLKIPKDIFKAIIEKPCAGGLARRLQGPRGAGHGPEQGRRRQSPRAAREAQVKKARRAKSPRAGDPVDLAEMRSLGGVSFIATIPDFTPRSANKGFRGQMAEKMSGKVNTETGADAVRGARTSRASRPGRWSWRSSGERDRRGGHRRGARGGRLRQGRHRPVRGEDFATSRSTSATSARAWPRRRSGSARRSRPRARSTPSRPSS